MTPQSLIERNAGLIGETTQKKIVETKLLFAGCGLGSAIVETCVRTGYSNLILVDGDTVSANNLNRQSFDFSDVGQSKVLALANRVKRINPEAKVQPEHTWLNTQNASSYVGLVDVVIDTVDFLDLETIVSVHDAAMELGKPVISCFTAGWGAVVMYIPPEKRKMSWIREIFDIGPGSLTKESYALKFAGLFRKMGHQLNPQVQNVMAEVFKKMADRKPCPAPHVAAGASLAAAIINDVLYRTLAKQKIVSAPKFIYCDLEKVVTQDFLQVELSGQ